MKFHISMFGPLKNYFETELILESNFSKVSQIRKDLLNSIKKSQNSEIIKSLITKSVFADSDKVLSENDELKDGSSLVLLPPVCGG